MIKTRLALPVLAATCAAILAGCGGGGDSSGSDPAALAPAKAPLYIEATVLPTGELQTNVDALAGSIAGVDDLGELIVTELESSAKDSGESFDYTKEVEPWLGEKAGMFFEGFDGDDFTDFGIAVQTTDTEAAQEFIDKQIGESDDEPTKGSYEGNDFYSEADGPTVGVVGDFVVIAEGDSAFEDAVDAEGGESLAEDDDFSSAISGWTDGSIADVFVDVGGLIQQSGEDVDAGTLEAIEATGLNPKELTAVASLIPGSDSVEIDLASDLGEFEEGFVGSSATEMLGSLPATSFAAFSSAEVGERLNDALDKIDDSGIPGEVPPHKLKSTLKAAGIDLEKIASSLGEAGVFATGNSRSSLGGAVVLTTDSSSEAANTVSSIGLLLRASNTPGVTAIGAQATGFSVRSDELGDKPVVVAAKGDRIAIGYGLPQTLTGLNAASGKTLSDSPAYKEAVSALGSTPISAFVDGPAALNLADALVPASEEGFQEAKPYLKKIGYVALGSEKEGDLAKAKLIVGLGK